MKNRIVTFINALSSLKGKKIIGIACFISLVVYFLLGISAYAQWFPGSVSFFTFNSKSGLVLRIITSILVVCSGAIACVSYRDSINFKWFILLGVMLLMGVIMVFVSKREFHVLYRGKILYDFLSESFQHVSLKTVMIMYFGYAVDLIFGFLFIFVLGRALNKTYYFYIFIIIFLLIMFYSFIYSFIKEKSYYLYFFKGNWTYKAASIGSIFGNKQQWGIFLAMTLPVTAVGFWITMKMNYKKSIKISIYASLIFISALSMICTLVAFCKTALVCNIVFFGSLAVGGIITLFVRKKYPAAIILSSIIFVFAVLITLIMTVPAISKLPGFSSIYKIIDTLLVRGEVGAEQRLIIIQKVLTNFPIENIAFGIPKGLLDAYTKGLVPELSNYLHTGIIIYFCRSGIFGLIVYVVLNVLLFISYIKVLKRNKLLGIILFSLFASSIVSDLAELEILIMSSSINVFMLNILGVVFPNHVLEKERGVSYEI